MPHPVGIMSGLQGYALKKEMLGEGVSLYYREIQRFSYEFESMDFATFSPANIQNQIYNSFTSVYPSGNINVKIFNIPAEYFFPNDDIRNAKFNVEVEVKNTPPLTNWMPELLAPYYNGLNYSSFFMSTGNFLLDFKEAYEFEMAENGNQVFTHNLTFGLRSGSKQLATAIASGIFANDSITTFGLMAMQGLTSNIADPTQYQNYYSESYDIIRNSFAFTRKRELLPTGVLSQYTFNVIQTLDLKDDGMVEVSEKGVVKGALNFNNAKIGTESMIGTAYGRCQGLYSQYTVYADSFSVPITLPLISPPVKVSRINNPPAMTVDYEVTYTNNPQYGADGTFTEEVIDLNYLHIGITEVKHSLQFGCNKRLVTTPFITMINNAISASPTTVNNYFQAFIPTTSTLNMIKKEIAWPNRKNKGAKVSITYSNHPKYFAIINGITYKTFDSKLMNVIPEDIMNEYKVINRPSKLSVINYAYQTERGKITLTMNAGIGRNPDEFVLGFRGDIGNYLTSLYQYACTVFFNEFKNVIPVAFTYFLDDVKYTYSFESGILQLFVSFTYTIKRYSP